MKYRRGDTYDPARDSESMNAALAAVFAVLASRVGRQLTLRDISRMVFKTTGKSYAETGLAARIRELRNPKHGRWDVRSRRSKRGAWLYWIQPDEHRASRPRRLADDEILKVGPKGARPVKRPPPEPLPGGEQRELFDAGQAHEEPAHPGSRAARRQAARRKRRRKRERGQS